MASKYSPDTFRKASMTSNLYGGLLHYKKRHDWGVWVFGMLFFDNGIPEETIGKIAHERILTIPRFRSRYDAKKKGFVEIDLEKDFDEDYHLRIVRDKISLDTVRNEYCGDVYKHMNFDPDKPLWQFTYFSNLEDGRSLLLTAINHVIGDGMSQIEILFRLLDKPKGDEGGKGGTLRPPEKRKAPKSTYGPLNRFRIVVGGLISPLFDVFGTPDRKNPLTRSNVHETGVMKLSFTEKVELEKVIDVKKKFEGATVNDILVALLTLTVNAYFDELEAKTGKSVVKRGQKLRAGFAISMRKKGEDPFRDGSPHNSIAQGLLKFYLKPKNCVDLVWRVKRQLDSIKLSPGPFVQVRIGNAVTKLLPQSVGLKIFTDFQSTTTALLSNVAGPKEKASLDGNEVSDLQFFVSAAIGCYFGLLSYNGQVSCGICMDETASALPKEIGKHWKTEFEKLYDECMAYEGPIPKPKGWRAKLDKL